MKKITIIATVLLFFASFSLAMISAEDTYAQKKQTLGKKKKSKKVWVKIPKQEEYKTFKEVDPKANAKMHIQGRVVYDFGKVETLVNGNFKFMKMISGMLEYKDLTIEISNNKKKWHKLNTKRGGDLKGKEKCRYVRVKFKKDQKLDFKNMPKFKIEKEITQTKTVYYAKQVKKNSKEAKKYKEITEKEANKLPKL